MDVLAEFTEALFSATVEAEQREQPWRALQREQAERMEATRGQGVRDRPGLRRASPGRPDRRADPVSVLAWPQASAARGDEVGSAAGPTPAGGGAQVSRQQTAPPIAAAGLSCSWLPAAPSPIARPTR